MTTTVSAIAAEAFDAVAAEFSDVVQTATLTRVTRGEYNPTTGAYPEVPATDTGRAVFDTQTPIADALGGYVGGPGELLVYIEGLDSLTPKESDKIAIGGVNYTIRHVGDIVGAGSFYACAVLKS